MGARELLHELAGAGFTVEVEAEKLVLRPASKLTDELRAELRAAKPELLALLSGQTDLDQPEPGGHEPAGQDRPYRLAQAESDAAHLEPWDDAAIGRFTARVVMFLRRGINATDADDLAEHLHLRDVQGDDRVACLECRHLAGRRGGWRCGDHQAAGVGQMLPHELVTMLQRCPGHQPAEGTAP